ncbi:T7SS effector LXG polymorphic toxin [Listeria welshimeri]|uniref:LXG domain-containing protein n=2 Tax=Listeria welshimeri TaxID=1643 RepID=A0A7X0T6D6_LISWE|nr:T7SS effector LXG polymorphic toxin [Listeria welshimeri]MBC1322191.1 hypothetical protein [Listeria welshimeri]MBC1620001.1 hypothetical protein [Listeria welshimeri]MBC1939555.1 hypothetical protein [Listeria welshimeri]MBF2484725.1 hypothetical protein [Listeria welshimeri]CAK19473.1 hypothetical protein lwe0055 [Listeria welshimeri serovar 6b str. SLCC5334]
MGKKIDFDEIQNASNDFNEGSNEEIIRLYSLLENIDEIGALESFQGKTAQTAKAYLNEVHGTVMILLITALTQVREMVVEDIDRFQQDVDSAPTTKIDQIYIKELKKKIEKNYSEFKIIHEDINKTVNRLNDLVPNAVPSKTAIKASKDNFIQNINLLNTHLDNYDERKRGGINEVKKIFKQIESILISEASYHNNDKGLIIYSPGDIYGQDGVDKELINGKMLDFLGLGGDTLSMAISSKELAVLAMNKGLTVQSRMVRGKLVYTIYGTKDQLQKLNVKMNASARSKSIVKLYDGSKTNKYTKYGAAFMEEFPLLRGMTHSKAEMLKGFSASMKEPYTGGYKNLSKAGKLAKGLGAFGAAMTVASNINSELADGFQGYTDVRRITVNSTVDLGVSGGLTAVLGQAGSSFGLPGTIGGIGVGVVLDTVLSLSGTKDTWKNSVNENMQHLEDWFWVEAK